MFYIYIRWKISKSSKIEVYIYIWVILCQKDHPPAHFYWQDKKFLKGLKSLLGCLFLDVIWYGDTKIQEQWLSSTKILVGRGRRTTGLVGALRAKRRTAGELSDTTHLLTRRLDFFVRSRTAIFSIFLKNFDTYSFFRKLTIFSVTQ